MITWIILFSESQANSLHLIHLYIMEIHICSLGQEKVNKKVQEEPQAEAIANPRHQEEDKKKNARKKKKKKKKTPTHRQTIGQDQTWSASWCKLQSYTE